MSQVQFAIVLTQKPGQAGAPIPASRYVGAPEVLTSGLTAVAGSLTPESVGITDSVVRGHAWRVVVKGSEDVVVLFSSVLADEPQADGSEGFYCLAGGTYEFAVDDVAEYPTIIEAS